METKVEVWGTCWILCFIIQSKAKTKKNSDILALFDVEYTVERHENEHKN